MMRQAQLALPSGIVAKEIFPHSKSISVPSPHKTGSTPIARKPSAVAVLPKAASRKSKPISKPSPDIFKRTSSNAEIDPIPEKLTGIKIPANVMRNGIGADPDLVFSLLRSLKPRSH